MRKPGFGIITISGDALEGMLHLPEGYHIVGMDWNMRAHGIECLLSSDALPEIPEGGYIPEAQLLTTVWYAPDDPKYRYYTTEIKLR